MAIAQEQPFSTAIGSQAELVARWWSSGRPKRNTHYPLTLAQSGLGLFCEWALGPGGFSPSQLCKTMAWSTKALDRLLAE